MSSTGLSLIEREMASAQQQLKDLMDARDSMQAQLDGYNTQIADRERVISDLQVDWAHLRALAEPVEPEPMPEPEPGPPEDG